MSGITRRKWILKSHFDGLPKRENVELVEEALPALREGEYLLQAMWLSVDPYIRPYSRKIPLGQPIVGLQVAKVIQSRNEKFKEGDCVHLSCGWVDHFICNDDTILPFGPVTKLDMPEDQISHSLGVFGVTGMTAYFGLLDICHPKEGETLVVNTGAGAVGSVVGQIAKIKGCRVIGFAGSDAKVKYMESLGFDCAYNYKNINSLEETLAQACPNGIDIFFDNVGGKFFSTVVRLMNQFGRVSLCGAISEYNEKDNEIDDSVQVKSIALNVVFNQIKIEGFIVSRWQQRFPEGITQLTNWMEEGKLRTKEHITEGFEYMFDAFLGLFRGDNIGKAVVKF